jgi:hypothetical protein
MEEANAQRGKRCLLCEHQHHPCRAFPQSACIGVRITRAVSTIGPRQRSFDRLDRQYSCGLCMRRLRIMCQDFC